jgi:hypothetical protein
MNEHHLSPTRLFVAGFLLFLIVVGGLIGMLLPLVAQFLGVGKLAVALLAVGLGTGIIGGLVFGLLLAGMGRTKTLCFPTHDPGVLQLTHDSLAKHGYTVFAQSPSDTTYCTVAHAQTYAQATASDHLSMRLLRFVGWKLCGIYPAVFFVHVIRQDGKLYVSGPAQNVHKVERELRTQGIATY